MDIQRCFEILEIDPDADADEAKQAYKDLVNIWHPDRFSSNPRLQKKSEDKLKEINIAYETIHRVLSSQKTGSPSPAQQNGSPKTPRTAPDSAPGNPTKDYKSKPQTGTSGKTEAFVEAGTGLMLNMFASLYTAIQRIVKDAAAEMDRGSSDRRQQNDANSNRYSQRDQGNGRSMVGRRGKGQGRGGGRGRGRR